MLVTNRDVVLKAAVSAQGCLEAVFLPVSLWLCLGDCLPWFGSASDFLIGLASRFLARLSSAS